jgi:hypothetical protein
MVLFGGQQGAAYLNDTWEWYSNAWHLRTMATHPLGRAYAAMAAYDHATATSAGIYMFGGLGASSARYGDLWYYDRNGWASRAYASAPTARYGATMGQQGQGGRMVVFGGYPATGYSNETFGLLAGVWSVVGTASTNPPARYGASLGNVNATLGLFGGYGSEYYSDTWTLSGSTWAEAEPESSVWRVSYDTERARFCLVAARRFVCKMIWNGQGNGASNADVRARRRVTGNRWFTTMFAMFRHVRRLFIDQHAIGNIWELTGMSGRACVTPTCAAAPEASMGQCPAGYTGSRYTVFFGRCRENAIGRHLGMERNCLDTALWRDLCSCRARCSCLQPEPWTHCVAFL